MVDGSKCKTTMCEKQYHTKFLKKRVSLLEEGNFKFMSRVRGGAACSCRVSE